MDGLKFTVPLKSKLPVASRFDVYVCYVLFKTIGTFLYL